MNGILHNLIALVSDPLKMKFIFLPYRFYSHDPLGLPRMGAEGSARGKKEMGRGKHQQRGRKKRTTNKGTTEGRRGRKQEGKRKRKEWGKGIGARGVGRKKEGSRKKEEGGRKKKEGREAKEDKPNNIHD